jgi:crotonobetaine/carnitine-CoA ligase
VLNSSKNVIGNLIEENGRIHKDRVFLFFEDQKITYEQLDLRSNQFGHGFRDFGIQKGDKVAIMMQNHPDYLYTWFGLAKVGAIEVPINTAYKGDSLKHIINNSDSKLLVIDTSLLDRLLIIREDLPQLTQIICRGNIDEQICKYLPIPVLS